MDFRVRDAVTPIWLLLVAATGVSWLVGHGEDGAGRKLAGVTVLVIAFVKVRLVLLHFMELRRAPLAWRLIFEAWVLIVGATVTILYLTRG